MQRFGGALALLDGVDDELRAVIHVAADEDVLLRRLIGQRIGDGVVAAVELDLRILKQRAPFDRLTDGEDDMVSRDGDRLALVIDGGEAARFGVDGAQAFFEYDGSYMAAFILQQLLRTPAGADLDVLFFRLGDLVLRGRHGLARFQTDHRDLFRTEAHRSAGAVNGDITAAADDNDAAVHMLRSRRPAPHAGSARRCRCPWPFARHARKPSALTADGDVEREEPLLTQLRDGHILTDLHAAADLHAKLTQNLNLRVDDGLLQLE